MQLFLSFFVHKKKQAMAQIVMEVERSKLRHYIKADI